MLGLIIGPLLLLDLFIASKETTHKLICLNNRCVEWFYVPQWYFFEWRPITAEIRSAIVILSLIIRVCFCMHVLRLCSSFWIGNLDRSWRNNKSNQSNQGILAFTYRAAGKEWDNPSEAIQTKQEVTQSRQSIINIDNSISEKVFDAFRHNSKLSYNIEHWSHTVAARQHNQID